MENSQVLSNNFPVLGLQLEKISLLWLRLAVAGENMIRNKQPLEYIVEVIFSELSWIEGYDMEQYKFTQKLSWPCS